MKRRKRKKRMVGKYHEHRKEKREREQ